MGYESPNKVRTLGPSKGSQLTRGEEAPAGPVDKHTVESSRQGGASEVSGELSVGGKSLVRVLLGGVCTLDRMLVQRVVLGLSHADCSPNREGICKWWAGPVTGWQPDTGGRSGPGRGRGCGRGLNEVGLFPEAKENWLAQMRVSCHCY